MAAETSTDAEVPVSLALMKLAAMFAWHYAKEVMETVFVLRNWRKLRQHLTCTIMFWFWQNNNLLYCNDILTCRNERLLSCFCQDTIVQVRSALHSCAKVTALVLLRNVAGSVER